MASSAQPGLSVIGQIAVPVKDIERATAFYRDVLGMRVRQPVCSRRLLDAHGRSVTVVPR
jgi:catechol 2,3-dioxygenase-like lactoylglutathione lyase family enzyme